MIRPEKILVAYFVQKGKEATSKSAAVARQAVDMLKAKGVDTDSFAITPVEEYPADEANLELATKAERDSHARPALVGKYSGMKDITGVMLVSPNWWDSFPQAVFSFLDDYDFAQTRVVPVIVTRDDARNVRAQLRDFLGNWVLPGVDVKEDAASDASVRLSEAISQLFEPSK
ncbi:MAG: hypothetical protein K2O24_04205 [Muribaculaceae bacterium]|nr:hypothetical protein [Muribaculaceae bacterium]